ncbi:hypothetical protein [Nocardia amamiensis]|uniref:hypothetical protein n=1 Tax=Nocardia amamiensis TaxID=404578 RepID=UPI0012F4A85C|nr:hypothetical protein [Nocardia amamiensis]
MTVLVGCGETQQTAWPPQSTARAWPGPITSAGPVAGQSAEVVAAAAMRELYTLRPAEEAPGDALKRVRPWLSESMNARLAALPPAPGASLRWGDWSTGRARVDAETFVSAERPPRELPGHADRKVGVAQTVSWPDGHRDAVAPFTVTVTLVEVDGGWRVEDYRTW